MNGSMASLKRAFSLTVALMLVIAYGATFASPAAKAASSTYYVAPNGSDSNDGQSLATPFKSIQKAADVAQPGDTVYVRGGTYRETVTPANSGTPDHPITYEAYQGENVVISGLDEVDTSWTPYSGNIYYTDFAMHLDDQNAVFVDGSPMTYARWPNKTGASPMTNDGAAIDDGSLTSITDADMPNQTPGFYNGAIVWSISGAKWTAWGATITDSGGGTLHFTIPGDMGDNLNPGDTTRGDQNYYYIAGKLGLLDTEKEWFYDTDDSRLYLYAPGGGDPGAHQIEVKSRVQAIDLTGKSYIHFKGIGIKGASMKITGDHNVIDGMTATYIFSHNARGMHHTHPVTDDGIHITGSYNTIENGNFGYSDGNIFLIDAGTDNLITRNYIHDGDLNGSYDALIRLENNFDDRNWTTITYNTMYNTGRSAIHFIRPAHFEHNEVFHTNIVGDDGAAVYMGSDLKGPDGTYSTVAYNIVHDVYWQSGSRKGVVSGIYMDGGTYNAVAHHNVVYNIGQDAPFRMNGPSNNTYLYNNTTFNTTPSFVSSCCSATYSQDNNYHDPAASNFVDAGNHDFHLAAGSGAIDAGQLHSPWTGGSVGSAPDLGAFEYGGLDWSAGVQGSPSSGNTSDSSGAYEAEAPGNTLEGGAFPADCALCSGGYAVGGIGNSSGTLQFNGVQASSAGTYNLTIYYLNGDTNARTASVSVNGDAGTNVSFPSTGTWSAGPDVGAVTITANLEEGENTIRFSTNDAGVWAPNVDKIAIAAVAPPTNTNTFEAEAAGNTLEGGAAVADCSTCSGGYVVGNIGNDSGTLQFNDVIAPSSGTYSLTISYINGDAGPRTALISVNGEAGTSFDFPSTGTWGSAMDPGALTVTVNLKAGANTIKFYTTDAGVWAPNIDKIAIAAVAPPTDTSTFEAEAAGNTLEGGASVSACDICSGGSVVGYVGNNSGTLQFNDLNVSNAGNYTLTIYYLNGDADARTSLMSVNGGAATNVSFPSSGSWVGEMSVGTVQVDVSLQAGANTIKFYTDGYAIWAPDFDKINLQYNPDVTPPVITVDAPTAISYSDDQELLPVFKADDISGVDDGKTVATLDGRPVQAGTSIPLYSLPLGSHTFTVEAADLAGNAGSVSVEFQTTASADSLQALVAKFADGGKIDNGGIAGSFKEKLKNGDLNAFVKETEAQRGKHVAAPEADLLIRDAKVLLGY